MISMNRYLTRWLIVYLAFVLLTTTLVLPGNTVSASKVTVEPTTEDNLAIEVLAERYSLSEEVIQEKLNQGYTLEAVGKALAAEGTSNLDEAILRYPYSYRNDSLTTESTIIAEDVSSQLSEERNVDVSVQSTASTEPPNFNYVRTHPDEAPYSVQMQHESISTLSGGLSLRYTDMTLPGRNGLGFSLVRRYDSNDSLFYQYPNREDDPKKKPFLETLYPIGVGWSWGLSAVEDTNYSKRYLHLADGGVYEVDDKSSSLKGYPWLDLIFARDTSVTIGTETSAYVLKSVRGVNEYFNAKGRIIQISDAYQNKIIFQYTDHPTYGKVLSSITDAIGNSIQITYSDAEVQLVKGTEKVTYKKLTVNGKEMLSQVIDQEGRTTTYDYVIDSNLNPYCLLNSVLHPTGVRSKYEYEPISRYIGEDYQSRFFRAKFRVDELTRVDGSTEISNNVTITYTGDMGSAYKQDLNFSATLNDGLTETTYSNTKDYIDEENSFYYNTNIVSKSGQLQQSIDYTYDAQKRYTKPTRIVSKWTDTQSGANSEVTETLAQYDAFGNVASSTDAMGVTTNYTYYPQNGLLATQTESVSASQTRFTRFDRNAQGSVTLMTVREGGPEGTILRQINYENYDAYGNAGLMRVKNGSNDYVYVTEYGQNYHGAFPTVQRLKTTNVDGVVSEIRRDFSYDMSSGRLVAYTDGNRNVQTYEYDRLGRLTKQMNPDNSFISVIYDDLQNQIEYRDETGIETVTKWNPLGLKVENGVKEWGWYKSKQKFGYDSYGRMIWSEDAVGNRTSFEYDTWGRQVKVVMADQKVTQIIYDDINMKVTTIDPEGIITTALNDKLGRVVQTHIGGTRVSTNVFDYEGKVRQQTDALGKITGYGYDTLSRLTSVTNAKNEETHYEYDVSDRLTKITFPDQATKTNQYDEIGRLIRTSDAKGQIEKYYYDANDNRTSFVDRNGVTHSYTYNNRNFLVSRTAPDETVTFNYDLSGRRTSMTDLTGTSTYTYNPTNGLLLKVTYPDGKQIQYDYDELGNRNGMTDPFGKWVSYQYDNRNRLVSVGSLPNGVDPDVTYSYFGNDLLKESVQKNGLKSTYRYDRLRIDTLTQQKADGTVINSYDYNYDDNNNQTSINENGNEQAFTYDPLNRIMTESQDNLSYNYDVRGNRQTLSKEGVPEKQDFQYEYDTENRLSKVLLQGGSTVAYKYNGDGLLVERTVDGKTIRYYYDGDQIISEGEVVDGAVVKRASYVRGNGLIYREDDLEKAYYLLNGHGDVTELRDETGDSVLNKYSYDIWGNPTSKYETKDNLFLYSGELWDSTTNLQYLRARWYDPSVGRFINEDTYEGQIDDPLTMNLYTYVLNNPLIYTDPSGMCVAGKDAGCYVDSFSGVDWMIGDPMIFNNSELWKQYQSQKAYCKTSSCTDKLAAKQKVLEKSSDEIRNSACLYVDCMNGMAKFTGMENGMPIITQDTDDGQMKYTLTKAGVVQCNCFTAGTKIQTDHGDKSIEEIHVGDRVLSKNEETGEVAYKEVTATYKHDTNEIYKIHVGNQTIEATYNHPFWVDGKGWVFVKDLIVGDALVQSNGNILEIDEISVVNGKFTVYNMTVDEFHTYFVSLLNIWVHNTGGCFPEDPHDFNPTGLIKKEYAGTKNGIIIKWFDPVTNKPIYEWNEDLKYGNHYHYTPTGNLRSPHPITGNTHIRPGDALIEEYRRNKK